MSLQNRLEAVPPPRIGFFARITKPLLFWMLRLYRLLDRMLGGDPNTAVGRDVELDGSYGPILSPADAPLLFRLLDHLDRRMGGVRPTEVRLGILPACGVVELPSPAGGPPRQTLLLGLPCFAIWSVDELSAVVAHEAAHLKLEDAVFTREVVRTAAHLKEAKGPRRFLARAVGLTVARLAARVCRQMELRADRWSAMCFRAETLAGAIEKLLVVQPIFRLVMLQKNQAFVVGDTVFDLFTRTWNNLPLEKFWELRSKLAITSQTGPLDPHPSIMDRLNRLAKARTNLAPPPSANAMELLVDAPAWKKLLHNRVYGVHEIRPVQGSVFFAEVERNGDRT